MSKTSMILHSLAFMLLIAMLAACTEPVPNGPFDPAKHESHARWLWSTKGKDPNKFNWADFCKEERCVFNGVMS